MTISCNCNPCSYGPNPESDGFDLRVNWADTKCARECRLRSLEDVGFRSAL